MSSPRLSSNGARIREEFPSSTMQCSSLLLFCWATSILVRFGAASSSAFIDDLFEPECLVARNLTDNFGQLPPTKKTPWAVINLDLPAEQRFGLAYRPFASRLQKTVSLVKAMVRSLVGQAGVNLFEALMAQLHDRLFPTSYQQEMEGVAQATGLSVPDLTALNLFYELAHLCTSIVAEDPQGRLVHGRTLDFGVVLGWDRHRHGWLLTQQLRALTLNLNFTQHGRSLFLGTTFAGHLGLLTGMRPHKFSVSVNSRLRSSGWPASLHSMASLLLQSAMAHSADSAASPVLWAQRNMLEQCADFEQAQRFLSTVPLMSGCFFALGGNSSGQGLILVRNRTSLEQQQQLNPTEGRWFLLQRNYAPGQPAFFLDGRAGTEKCLQRLGRPRANWEGLLTVLSSKNTLNKCTVHTTMMNVREGLYQTYLQNCPEPCWFI